MIEIKKKKQIYFCLNMVYINYPSTDCTFIFLLLGILKLLPTNYKPGQGKHFRNPKFQKVKLFLRVNISG